jgi:type III secretion protein R
MKRWLLVALLFLPSALFAQGVPDAIQTPPLIAQMLVLVGLALLPFLVLLLTSFTKMVIVLALLRSAMGVQQAPPNQVINGIALILVLYVMFPTGMAMYERVEGMLEKAPTELVSVDTAVFAIDVIKEAREPLREFMIKNSRAKHQRAFYRIAYKFFPPQVRSTLQVHDFIILVPAYITSQVEDAFQIGVMIYLPFFVVDLVTSNILLAMGMMMLSPITIAIPLKLLLLVMLDGWSILVQGLVLSFNP